MLSGPLAGVYDPHGTGSMLFAVPAVAEGDHGGRPKVVDDDVLTFAIALKDMGVPVPGIAGRFTIPAGRNAGKSPSVAWLCRAPAEAGDAAADDGQLVRPKRARIRVPGDQVFPLVRTR